MADVQILSSAERVVVSFDETRVTPADLKQKITDLGYRVEEEPDRSPLSRRRATWTETIRLAFVGLVAAIALLEILGKSLGFFEKAGEWIPVPVALMVVLIGGYPIFRRAFLGLRALQINIDLMMTVGILGAAAIGEVISSALIVFFMIVAHYLEDFTTDKARAAIKELMRLAPQRAWVKRDGQEVEMEVEALRPGDIAVVRPGAQIPADGRVVAGASAVNQASITGESLPVEKRPGDGVFAGTFNERGYLEVEVERVGRDTTLGKIIRLVEEAEATKAPIQKFADRFTTYFLPVAIGIAVLTYLFSGNPRFAIAVLVAACPCAVGLATPLSVVASAGAAARRGLLIKGGLYLELLAKVDAVVVDKTGTLTFGRPMVTDIVSLNGLPEAQLLRQAAAVERYSEHPLATAVVTSAKDRGILIPEPQAFEAIPGQGVVGRVDGSSVALGNARLLQAYGVKVGNEVLRQVEALEEAGKTVVLVAQNGEVAGLLAVADTVRDEVPQAIQALQALGIRRLLLLTGDNERVAAAVARAVGISEYRANLLPEDKITCVKELQTQGHVVAMIGDGVNDAPALAQADVGIAMGVAGTDVALEAADVALMGDDWRQIPQAIKAGRRTARTIRQNITFGILWDVVTMGLASVGILSPVMAAATEAMPDVLVSLNSAKLLKDHE